MRRRPRPSTESIVNRPVKLTAGLVGLYMAIVMDAVIQFGHTHYHSTAIGASIALTAFGLMLIVGAYESRGVSVSIITREAFDNPKMNWTAVAEIALAVAITQMDLFNRLLKTVPLTGPQMGLALGAAVLLFALWELGKLIARRQEAAAGAAVVETA
jgi:Ca2+-transporting ATPase